MNSPEAKRPYFETVREGEETLCAAGIVYCHRHPEQPANKFVLREPKDDRQNSGRPAISLLSVLMDDA